MMRFQMNRATVGGLVLVAAMCLPSVAAAQSAIAGVVTDATGGILPGVTVQAASPALIERTRVVVTDSSGRYTVVDLRPGVYSVTFSLEGFSTFVRQGIEVAANITVPLNAQMRLGALEETLTVTGQTPLVDVQQAAQRQVLNRDMLDSLPTSRSYLSTGVVMPAVKLTRPDMGGITVGQGAYISARGKSSNEDGVEIDGMDVRISNGVSQSGYNNFAMVQDVTYQTSSVGADSSAGGVRINMIPREGGNKFSGDFYLGGTRSALQSNNITPALKARGLASPDSLNHLIESTPSYGGPILRDKIWFFASGRYNVLQVHPAGAKWRDGSDAWTRNGLHMASARLTWSITARHKLTAYMDKTFKSQDHTTFFTSGAANPAGVEWETATASDQPSNFQLGYLKWTSPVSSRLLLEGGFAFNVFNTNFSTFLPGIRQPRGTPEWFAAAPRQDIVLGTLRGGPGYTERYAWQPSKSYSTSASYVTGSHSFKTGFQYRWQGIRNYAHGGNADLVQRYRSGVPDSVLVGAVPNVVGFHVNDFGLYAMDSWVLDRLTINPGLRFEVVKGFVDDSVSSPGRFVPLREVQQFQPVPTFIDFTPRLSAVYDLFGTAKTALKVSVNRYLTQINGLYLSPYNPTNSGFEIRNWFDRDLIPGTSTASGLAKPTNGDDIAQDNEIGPSNNARFGFAAERRADSGLERQYSWDYSASIQHALVPRVSVTFGWYQTRSYDEQRTANILRSVSDYASFQATNPLSGEPITIFNLNRARQGLVDRVDTTSDINRRLYTGFEASAQARLYTGNVLIVGWAMEKTRTVTCDSEDPNAFRFCDQTGETFQELGRVPGIPYRHEFKMAGAFPLPWGFQSGVSLLSYPGNPLNVAWIVPAGLFPGGRTESVTVSLIPPGTKYLERWNQLDVNVKRRLRAGRYELQPTLEVFNLTNSAVVLGEQQTFGATLGRPTSTLQGRFVKLSVLVKF